MISDFVNLFYHQGRSELERRLSIVTSQRESKRDISDLLECPVCLETCQKETFVCRFGHLVCSGCKVQGNIKLCPVCRCPNLQKLSQFSEIVKKYENFSCTNGCGHLASDARKLAEHVEICLTKWRKCPVLHCGESGHEFDIRSHLICKHPEMCFSFGAQLTVGIGQMPEINTVFLLGLENIVVFKFQQKNGFTCSAFYWEPCNDNLFVKLIFSNETTKSSSIKRVLIPVFKEQSKEGFTSAYRDMNDFVYMRSDETLALAVNISISNISAYGKRICHHDEKRCLFICPDIGCNKLFHCPTCHAENAPHYVSQSQDPCREVMCCKCYFSQKPSTKCISCRRALDLNPIQMFGNDSHAEKITKNFEL